MNLINTIERIQSTVFICKTYFNDAISDLEPVCKSLSKTVQNETQGKSLWESILSLSLSF